MTVLFCTIDRLKDEQTDRRRRFFNERLIDVIQYILDTPNILALAMSNARHRATFRPLPHTPYLI